MKRLFQLAKEIGVSNQYVIDYFKYLGYAEVGVNFKVDDGLEKQLKEFQSNGNLKFDNDLIITEALPEEFNLVNPYAENIRMIVLNSDPFKGREIAKRDLDGHVFESVFSDFEAFSVCYGLENRHSKLLARRFFKNNVVEPEQIVEAHSIASVALTKYGSKLLSFMISLPPLPFKSVDVTQIFSELDKRKSSQDFPIIRFLFQNQENEMEKIQVSFFAEKHHEKRIRNNNVLFVKNITNGKEVMKVSRNGHVLSNLNAKNIFPVFQAFTRFCQNTKQTIIHYGLETGECSICGRPLTDSESIRLGIGPICRQYV
ncbi:MAG: DUF6011 domain-containing protein [Flavobacterium sp.]